MLPLVHPPIDHPRCLGSFGHAWDSNRDEFLNIGVLCERRKSHLYQWCSVNEVEQKRQRLVVIGGGAAGVFGAIKAKTLCPHMDVVVLEKGGLLSKVKISGGGRCNVTTGLFVDPLVLSEQYPRGHKELRGSFFRTHGPRDTAMWFSQHGVELKTEEDGRIFPASNNSATIVDCLLKEARNNGVLLETGTLANSVSLLSNLRFDVKVNGPETSCKSIQADYLLLATGSSQQGYNLAVRLGHTLVPPVPSLFTFKVPDAQLKELAGMAFPNVRVELEIIDQRRRCPHFHQAGPMLITHWGLSGPVILRLSAWAARDLFLSKYQGTLWVDFVPKLNLEDVVKILVDYKGSASKQKLRSAAPNGFSLARRFWQYLLFRMGIDANVAWASLSKMSLTQIASSLKRYPFPISGKGEFKDEFVTAGGVRLTEVNLKTMESRICSCLYFAGEILNVDGVTGGFNFQNAWTGGYIAGTNIANKAIKYFL